MNQTFPKMRKTPGPGAVVFCTHVAAAVFYHAIGAISSVGLLASEAGEWHLLPADLLRDDLFRSLWDLHAQPPLYNAWAGVFAKMFYPGHLTAMTVPQIVLGGLISAMSYKLLAAWMQRPRLAFILGLLLALNPALFMYEPLGYEMLTAFAVTLTVWLFMLHDAQGRPWALVAALGTAAALSLTRGAYHPIVLAPLGLLSAAFAGPYKRRVVIAALVISLIPLAWLGKNQARFGFFGTSSWGGQNLWKIASLNYEAHELQSLTDAGVLDPRVVHTGVFRLPDEYRPLGFTATSPAPAINRNNRNNINIPAVSRMYGGNGARLILHDPAHYARNVLKAYRVFCLPSAHALPPSASGLFRAHDFIASTIAQGRFIPGASFWVVILPLVFALYTRRLGRLRPSMHAAALLIAYTAVVSCLFEYGENDRFKFAIEPILWPFTLALMISAVSGYSRTHSIK